MAFDALTLTCFKAYDIRGRLGDELNEDIAYRIGRAFAEVLGAKRVVIGRDVRPTSESLANAVARGLMACGVEVLDLGLSGTEETYFATTHLGADGGICVTASHNPMDYNGMKMVRAGSAPIGKADGMAEIQALAESGGFAAEVGGGRVVDASDTRAAYVEKLLKFVEIDALKPLKILVNAGNGAAGPSFDALAEGLAASGSPLQFVRMHHEPDGRFPNGIPNPLLDENQPVTADAVVAESADMGVAWDGDFDRCFFFDHEGGFIPGEYVVALLAEAFLAKEAGAKIIHDPRIIWATQAVVSKMGGEAIQSQCGHSNIKQVMRDTGAVYGGEMSAHHYFRDFMACDSGMIPWLLVAELVSRRGESLKDLVAELRSSYPSSGERNFRVDDAKAMIAKIDAEYGPKADARDETDGLSLSFSDWRFNLRASNTEPLLRLNIESKADAALVQEKLAEMQALIAG
ncbi:phosphomannomutase [Maritalea mobilis]|uniref:phosphomannomutase n=1 Tax=Maritalea mobilis TaxID=483324 RepID=UPI001C94D713|nr:phosphomannomutase [Maritalea mobilis]MBY6200888.1 phosphomannomutase [Maritalea mobilis]